MDKINGFKNLRKRVDLAELLLKSTPVLDRDKRDPKVTSSVDKLATEDAYQRLTRVFGREKVILVAGSALNRLLGLPTDDMDFAVLATNFEHYRTRLESAGFKFFRSEKLWMFSEKIYRLTDEKNKHCDKKIQIDIFGTDGLVIDIPTKYFSNPLISKNILNGEEVLIAQPKILIAMNYRAWKNRWFNGRGDRDTADIKTLIDTYYGSVSNFVSSEEEFAKRYAQNLGYVFEERHPLRNAVSIVSSCIIRPIKDLILYGPTSIK